MTEIHISGTWHVKDEFFHSVLRACSLREPGSEIRKDWLEPQSCHLPADELYAHYLTLRAPLHSFIHSFIHLFMAALGLRCCAWAFSSCSKRGLLFVVVRRLLIAVASLCCRARALGAQASVVVAHRLSSCGSRA